MACQGDSGGPLTGSARRSRSRPSTMASPAAQLVPRAPSPTRRRRGCARSSKAARPARRPAPPRSGGDQGGRSAGCDVQPRRPANRAAGRTPRPSATRSRNQKPPPRRCSRAALQPLHPPASAAGSSIVCIVQASNPGGVATTRRRHRAGARQRHYRAAEHDLRPQLSRSVVHAGDLRARPLLCGANVQGTAIYKVHDQVPGQARTEAGRRASSPSARRRSTRSFPPRRSRRVRVSPRDPQRPAVWPVGRGLCRGHQRGRPAPDERAGARGDAASGQAGAQAWQEDGEARPQEKR